MQNHHHGSVSTSIKKSAQQIFWAQDPFRVKQCLYSISNSMRQFAIYTQDPQFTTVLGQLQYHSIPYECHVMRTRFWISMDNPLYSYFALVCKDVTNETDHALGI